MVIYLVRNPDEGSSEDVIILLLKFAAEEIVPGNSRFVQRFNNFPSPNETDFHVMLSGCLSLKEFLVN